MHHFSGETPGLNFVSTARIADYVGGGKISNWQIYGANRALSLRYYYHY
jgi:hypothetical protein